METLKDYFSYEKDVDGVSEIYENLSRQLKVIHSNELVVPNLSSNEIIYEKELSFKPIKSSNNFQAEKRNNILALGKMMIGTYLSLETGFKDFSTIDDQWFLDNFDSIFSTISVKDFDKEYFSAIFLEGKDYYYSDYLDRKRQSESLQGKSNLQGYKKVLKTAGSALYADSEEEEVDLKEKTANMQIAFNPVLIGISLAILTILLIMYALVN